MRLWSNRLVGLGVYQLHLYDREQPPETETRLATAARVNLHSRCEAIVTRKRALENYLHPAAIHEACGISVDFTDDDSVAELVARQRFAESGAPLSWDQLTSRGRRRLRCRVKRDLNTSAVERMTVPRLDHQDPAGEIRQWLRLIADIVAD